MKAQGWHKNETGEIVYETDYGEFTKRVTHRGYSVHVYSVRKVSGEWPSETELMAFCDERTGYFGGEAVIGDETAMVTCHID